ncbi:hypothetical protein BHECKSOX_229 [Bathymodiolus heckerae thiotrophic gill symbiont]|uniref:hypothetical protein n=1 Tax=Bathymodiolus heckerae thiotrophic gill symbiont TaxID=1052212 RepID=UPI0010B5EFFA|nr:hypothetical protein [Bathymodiolus heckerae thiotrophic gill symbiont]SHN93449.1 hypothetical protein BHECKSOX_229 [Bathymodiolus heckerae thiotrophic gill symbiont]
MSKLTVITVVESMLFPNYGNLYQDKGLEEYMVNSIRKAISLIKKRPAAVIVVEFFYAYSTNYSGVYKSNLEVLLVSLIKYSPNTKVIVLAKKKEMQFINVLNAVDYPLHGVLQLPTLPSQMKALLDSI